jgi:hypothetical protein
MRVTRPGGSVSAIACFFHSDGLPHYHGRYPLPGNHRIDHLSQKLWGVWRLTVRPRLLGVDHDILNLDLVWQFRAAGLQDVQINGHLRLFSPGDARVPLEEGAAYALAAHQQLLERIIRWRDEHGQELAAAGFSPAEFDELITLKRARYKYLQGDPARVREMMEVFNDPNIIIRGTRPPV